MTPTQIARLVPDEMDLCEGMIDDGNFPRAMQLMRVLSESQFMAGLPAQLQSQLDKDLAAVMKTVTYEFAQKPEVKQAVGKFLGK